MKMSVMGVVWKESDGGHFGSGHLEGRNCCCFCQDFIQLKDKQKEEMVQYGHTVEKS
jgi:hypothetical protein